MPVGITYRDSEKSAMNVKTHNDGCDPIFQSTEEMNKNISRLCYGNFHTIGRLWIEGMRSVMVGSKMCLVPTVHAAPPKKDEAPKKPPRMKYKDLPLYERPHFEYKQHQEDEETKCLGRNPKILQEYVLPSMRKYRQGIETSLCELQFFAREVCSELAEDLCEMKEAILCQTRCPDNLMLRRLCVAAGTTAGLVFGTRKGYLYTRLFWGSVGALTTGWLCFPHETDEAFRDVCYQFDKGFLMLKNLWYSTSEEMPVIGPCDAHKPKPPPPRKVDPKHICKSSEQGKKPPSLK